MWRRTDINSWYVWDRIPTDQQRSVRVSFRLTGSKCRFEVEDTSDSRNQQNNNLSAHITAASGFIIWQQTDQFPTDSHQLFFCNPAVAAFKYSQVLCKGDQHPVILDMQGVQQAALQWNNWRVFFFFIELISMTGSNIRTWLKLVPATRQNLLECCLFCLEWWKWRN